MIDFVVNSDDDSDCIFREAAEVLNLKNKETFLTLAPKSTAHGAVGQKEWVCGFA